MSATGVSGTHLEGNTQKAVGVCHSGEKRIQEEECELVGENKTSFTNKTGIKHPGTIKFMRKKYLLTRLILQFGLW